MKKVKTKETSITLENLLEVNTVSAAETRQDAQATPFVSVEPIAAKGRGRERITIASAITV